MHAGVTTIALIFWFLAACEVVALLEQRGRC